MDEKAKTGITDYFALQKLLLRGMGISFKKENSWMFNCYTALILILESTSPIVSFAEIVARNVDFDYRINSVAYTGGAVSAACKGIIIYFNRHKMAKIMDSLHQGTFVANENRGGPIEETLIRNCIRSGTRQSTISVGLVVMVILFGLIPTTIKRLSSNDHNDWALPFQDSFSLFDISKSPNFELVWFYQNIVYPLGAITFICTDMIFSVFCCHISVQFKLLANFIVRALKRSYAKDAFKKETVHRNCSNRKRMSWMDLKLVLKEIVSYHNAIISLVNALEEVFNPILFCHHFGTFFMMCSAMYHMSVIETTDSRFIKDIAIISCTIFEIMIISYWANDITLESQKIAKACLDANFYGTDVRFQKGLVMVIQRSQKPLEFTIGKLAPLTLMMAIGSLRAIGSYFMVLRNYKASLQT